MTAAPADHERHPLVVELVGPPGGGKTTLLPVVVAGLRGAGLAPMTVTDAARPLAARTRLGRLLGAGTVGGASGDTRGARGIGWAVFRLQAELAGLQAAVTTWPLAWRVLRSQRGRPAVADVRGRRVLRWWWRVHGAVALFRRHGRPDEVLVLDEGYVHRVVQLFASGVESPSPDAVADYLEVVPAPDLVIAIRTPVEACVARIRHRGVWARLSGADEGELERFVTSAHRATTLAVEAVRQRGLRLVEIDNDGVDPVAAAEALQVVLAAALVARPGPARTPHARTEVVS